jgi:predicted glutamine amidotransferase
MCRFFAISAKRKMNLKPMANAYLVHFGATNSHGTGLAYIDNDTGKMTVVKRKQPAIDFVLKNNYHIKSSAMIGHLRLACSGKISDRNSHPFTSCKYSKRKIALAHNGMLNNYEATKKEFKKRHEFKSDVDSEILLHFYEEYGTDFIKKLNEKDITGMANIVILEDDGTILAYSDGNLYTCEKKDMIIVLQEKLYNNCKEIKAGNLVKIKDGKIISQTDVGTLNSTVYKNYCGYSTDYTKWIKKDGYYMYDNTAKPEQKDENEGYLPEIESFLCENFGLENCSITVLERNNKLNIMITDVDPIQLRELNRVFSCFTVVDSSGEDYVDVHGRIKTKTFKKIIDRIENFPNVIGGELHDN